MSDGFKDHFSNVAAGYQAFRPGYPPALFDGSPPSLRDARARSTWAAAPGRLRLRLRPTSTTIVLDPSAEQIAHAEPHPRVSYRVAPAEATGLPAACADLADRRSGPSLFDPERLHPELGRIARPGAVFAAFTYDLCRVGSPTTSWIASIATSSTLLAAGARPCGRRLSDAAVPVARDRRTSPGHRGIVDARAIHRVPGDLVRRERLPPEDGRRSARSRGERVARRSAGADPKREVESHDLRGARRPRASLGHEDARIASVSSTAASPRR